MKILICSYAELLKMYTPYALKTIKEFLHEAEIIVRDYSDENQLILDLKDVDGLITFFIPITKKILESAKTLKYISIASTGYSNVDMEVANNLNIKVSNIKEYCTEEVADHSVALILSLARKLNILSEKVKNEHNWDYTSAGKIHRLNQHTLALFGLGRIGQAVAKRAMVFGMNVLAYDPYLPQEIADSLNVKLVSVEQIQKEATIISNHMNASDQNTNFFNKQFFDNCIQQPIFINVARGQSVDEEALIEALNNGSVSSAGLDVFKSENPDLSDMELIQHPHTIVTPHAAFYSEEAIQDSDRISVMNMIYALKGEHEKVFAFVTK